MIAVENVDFTYGRKSPTVLHQIQVTLDPHEVTALVGPNGCGKTTLGKLMAGILKPTRGQVRVDGLDTRKTDLSVLGQHIGYLFQEPERQLFASSVRDELAFVFDLMGEDKAQYADKVDQMLSRFHLEHLADDFPFQLSRGEKQRLAIATVMINNPAYYIFDEPTTGLDEIRRQELSDILLDLSSNRTGMMIISHDRSFIERHAQRIVRMEGGKVIEDRRIA
jgi:energy-coupling factor transport system ATP-binding protein